MPLLTYVDHWGVMRGTTDVRIALTLCVCVVFVCDVSVVFFFSVRMLYAFY